MNLFSFILLASIIYLLVRCKFKIAYQYLFALALLIASSMNFGYFIKVAGTSIDYYRFLLYVVGALSLCQIAHPRIYKKDFVRVIAFLFTVLLGWMFCYGFKYQITQRQNGAWDAYLFGVNNLADPIFGSTNIKLFLDAFFLCCIAIYASRRFDTEWWRKTINYVCGGLKVVIIYGFIEAILVYVLGQTSLSQAICGFIFGVADSTYMTALSRGGGYQLQGLFREPAQYARGLTLMVLLLISNQILSKKDNKIWIAMIVILMLFSMSFTSLLMITFLGGLWIIYKCKENKALVPIYFGVGSGVCIIGVFLMFYIINSGSYFGVRLGNALEIVKVLVTTEDFTTVYSQLVGRITDGSSILRMGSSFANLVMNLKYNVLFGIGLGNSVSFSYTSNLITDIGVLGFIQYWRLFGAKNKTSPGFYAIVWFFIVCLLTNIVQPFGVDTLAIFFVLDTVFGVKSKQIIDKLQKKEKEFNQFPI